MTDFPETPPAGDVTTAVSGSPDTLPASDVATADTLSVGGMATAAAGSAETLPVGDGATADTLPAGDVATAAAGSAETLPVGDGATADTLPAGDVATAVSGSPDTLPASDVATADTLPAGDAATAAAGSAETLPVGDGATADTLPAGDVATAAAGSAETLPVGDGATADTLPAGDVATAVSGSPDTLPASDVATADTLPAGDAATAAAGSAETLPASDVATADTLPAGDAATAAAGSAETLPVGDGAKRPGGRPPLPRGHEQAPAVLAKLAIARAEFAATEDAYQRLALASALGAADSGAGLAAVKTARAGIEARIGDLEAAHTAAVAADAALLSAQRRAIWNTQFGACRRHLRNREDAAGRLSIAIENVASAYRDMWKQGRLAERAGTAIGLGSTPNLVSPFGATVVPHLVARELYRVVGIRGDLSAVGDDSPPLFPGSRPLSRIDHFPGSCPALAEEVKRQDDGVLISLEKIRR